MSWMAEHDQRMQQRVAHGILVLLQAGAAALVVVLVMTMTGASALALSNGGGGGGGSSSAGDFGSRVEAFQVIERILDRLSRAAREVRHAMERALSRERDWGGGRGHGDRNSRGR